MPSEIPDVVPDSILPPALAYDIGSDSAARLGVALASGYDTWCCVCQTALRYEDAIDHFTEDESLGGPTEDFYCRACAGLEAVAEGGRE